MKKLWIVGLLIVLAVAVGVYIIFSDNSIKIVSEENIPQGQNDSSIISAKGYDVSYDYGKYTERYYVQKLTFQDDASAEAFESSLLKESENMFINRTAIKIKDFDGHLFNVLGVDSRKNAGYGFLVRNRNVIIYASGSNEDTLYKVGEWFIGRY